MSTTKAIAGFRRADTRVGDSIQVIAVRELGDADRWRDLVNLNGLTPPYITDDLAQAGPSVLLAGQQSIKVPSPAPAATGVADVESVFGIDLSLARGRLAVAPGGDLLTIAGVPNLDQALSNRLGTPLGELIRHPDYGCDVYKLIGQGGGATSDRLAVSKVVQAIRSDRRIDRVENATGSIAGDQIAVTADAITVDGKRIPTGLPGGATPAPTLPQ